jgi:endonuclease/exonuclease/phosphatase (EEP) superfamily protein YafD
VASRALVALAAGWLAYVLAQRVLSGRWWLWLVPDLAPPLVFAAVPALLLAAPLLLRAARRRMPPAALGLTTGPAALALLLGLGQVGLSLPVLSGGGDGPAPAGAVRVVAWNTEFWSQGDDPAAFYAALTARDADLYLLSEYLHWDGSPRRIDDLAGLRTAFPGYQVVVHGELVTLSRLPVLSQRVLAARDLPAPGSGWTDYWTDKTLRTDVRTGTGTLSVYNVHVPTQLEIERSPLTPGFYEVVREQDRRRTPQLDALEADVAANPGAVLVAGDFNSTGAMGDLSGLEHRLTDAARAGGGVLPTSWPASGPLPRMWRLDWAFTSDGVGVHRYALTGPAGQSDHLVQELTVSVGGAR